MFQVLPTFFFDLTHFWTQKFVDSNFFDTKFYWGQKKNFRPQFFGGKLFSEYTFFLPQTCFDQKNFMDSKFFRLRIYLDPKFLMSPRSFMDHKPKFLLT